MRGRWGNVHGPSNAILHGLGAQTAWLEGPYDGANAVPSEFRTRYKWDVQTKDAPYQEKIPHD